MFISWFIYQNSYSILCTKGTILSNIIFDKLISVLINVFSIVILSVKQSDEIIYAFAA